MKLSDQERAILVDELCALIDSLIDLLIAIDPDQPAASRPRLRTPRASLTDDSLDVARRLVGQLPPPSEPGGQYFWAYPLKAVWNKKIRTSRN